MTVATALGALAEMILALAGLRALRWLIALAGLGQLAGAALFGLDMWRRVRMPPSALPCAQHALGPSPGKSRGPPGGTVPARPPSSPTMA